MTHNPAGLAKLRGTHFSLGQNALKFSLSFQRTGTYEASGESAAQSYEGAPYPKVRNKAKPRFGAGEVAAIPWFGFSTDLGHPEWPLRIGVGLVLPQAYASRGFDERIAVQGPDLAPGPQRYDVIRQDAALINPSLAIAYSPWDSLDIGARFSWGIGTLEGARTSWISPNFEEFEGRETVFEIERARDTFVPNFGLGVLYRPSTSWELGAAYSSQVEINAQGNGSAVVSELGVVDVELEPVSDAMSLCATGGTREALKSCVSQKLARHLTVGGRYIGRRPDGSEHFDVELDVRWEDWSNASDTAIIVDALDTVTVTQLNETFSRHGFRDVYSFRLGGSYTVPVGTRKWILRAGQAFDTAAAPNSFIRADLDGKSRWTSAAGVAFEGAWYRIELGVGYVFEPDVTVSQCKSPNGPSVMDQGCAPGGGETPVKDRTAPDPLQPKITPISQVESPYNAGRYESNYILSSLGINFWF